MAHTKLTKKQLIEDVLALHTWPIDALLLLRLLLDKPTPPHDVHQDIRDLEYFPERLTDSYHAEWIAYIKRDLYRYGFSGQGLPKDQLIAYLSSKQQDMTEHFSLQLASGLTHVIFAQKVTSSGTVTILPSPLKRRLHALLDL